MNHAELRSLIPIVDHKGVPFLDIGPLLADPDGLKTVINQMDVIVEGGQIKPHRSTTVVAGFEARGFPIGGALAERLGVGFVMLRKPGQLPPSPGGILSVTYQKEYGTDTIEVHRDLIKGKRVILVDDILAKGGTMDAGCRLVELAGESTVVCCLTIAEILACEGRAKMLTGRPVHSILQY